jgi:hypothetical protein
MAVSPEPFFSIFFNDSDSFVNALYKKKKVPGFSCWNYRYQTI